jgi:UTP--glucose-1-phosphate uridylyltransferase
MSDAGLEAATRKMEEAGVPAAAVRTFADFYRQIEAGETGELPEDDLEPIEDLPALDDLPAGDDAPLDRAVVIKLNGGLGTSMGMDRAKSLVEVKDGRSFLDVVAGQVLALRGASGARVPLVLMNSFVTRDDTLAALEAHPDLESDVPLDFVQNREPKLTADTLEPVEWPEDPHLEWCPPGHGDLYTALLTSGMLDTLLERGYRYAFVSNSDNLGATLEPRILGWMAREGVPFVSESCPRTEADRKGGHLAVRRADGQLVLRESAQTREEDTDAFGDVSRHRFFNANNLWVDLEVLRDTLAARDGVLGLPLIRNEKTVDPADASSPAVVQIESAMGAAVGVFEGARAVLVGRDRFAPVKTTDDLLVLRSDVYALDDGFRMVARTEPPFVALASGPYKLLRDFDARFPAGPPSLRECDRLEVEGDWTFGTGVVCRGSVALGPEGGRIEDRAALGGE